MSEFADQSRYAESIMIHSQTTLSFGLQMDTIGKFEYTDKPFLYFFILLLYSLRIAWTPMFIMDVGVHAIFIHFFFKIILDMISYI